MATGDLKGSLRKLQASLRALKYPRDVDYQRLAKGDPFCCLPILSYAFTSFSPALAELLVESGIELTGKNDLSFTESVYKVLRDLFSYKPLLTKQQFLQFGFAERKISLLCDIISLVLTKHTQLSKGTTKGGVKPVGYPKRRLQSRTDSKSSESSASPDPHRIPAQRLLSRTDSKSSESSASPDPHRIPAQRLLSRTDSKSSESPTSPDPHRIPVVLSRPLVERHLGSSSPLRASVCSDTWPQENQDEEDEEEGGETSAGDSPHLAAHPGCVSACTLRAVETGLRECVSRLAQLDVRLQALERTTSGTIVIEHSHWENLESRVLLLETRLALASAQGPVKAGGVISLPDSGDNTNLPDETVLTSVHGPGSSPTGGPSESEACRTTQPPAGLPSTSPEEIIKERLERIANMMKDTSSLLKTTF